MISQEYSLIQCWIDIYSNVDMILILVSLRLLIMAQETLYRKHVEALLCAKDFDHIPAESIDADPPVKRPIWTWNTHERL